MKKWLKNCLLVILAFIAIVFLVCFFAWKGVASSIKPKAEETPVQEEKDELTSWFEKSDKELKAIGGNIEGVINELYQTAEKYAGEAKADKEKAAKNLALLEEAEAIRAKALGGNWPQVLQQWVIKSEEELDKKVAEIKSALDELKESEGSKTAMQKDAEEELARVKGKLEEFKKIKANFQAAWDKAKVHKMSGNMTTNVQEEIDFTRKATDSFISEAKEIKK